MKIILKGTDIDLSPSINQYVDEKIGGLDRFLKSLSGQRLYFLNISSS